MKESKIREAYNKIELDEIQKERIFLRVKEKAYKESNEKRKFWNYKKITSLVAACACAIIIAANPGVQAKAKEYIENISNWITGNSKDDYLEEANVVVENKTIINSNSQLSKEEIVKEVWLNELKENSKQEMYKLLDYKIESVKIVNFNDIKKGFPGCEEYYPGVKDSDIFATVIYSVKPDMDIESSFWLAGGGEIAGEWIKNKEINLWIIERDGEYSIESSGGGW